MLGVPYALTLSAALAQDDILAAICNRNAALAFNAFMGDSLMCGVTLKDGKALYQTMLQSTKAYLDGWSLEL